MPRILDTGTRRGVAPNESGTAGSEDVYRYVTFESDNGAHHTLIVSPDHPLTDPKAIIEAFYQHELETSPAQPAEDASTQGASPGGGY